MRKIIGGISSVFALICSSYALADNEKTPPKNISVLENTGVFTVEADELEPSGLTLCNGKLLFIADKNNNEIYEVSVDEKTQKANVSVFKTLGTIPEPPEQDFPLTLAMKRKSTQLAGVTGGMDWEGITCNDQGDIFLASEYYFSVLKVAKDGKLQWLGKDIFKSGYEKGLFQVFNAYIEGIVWWNDALVLAAERDPRGMMVLQQENKTTKNDDFLVKDIYVQPGPTQTEKGISYDYAGLEVFNNTLIALDRNTYQVCQLDAAYQQTACASFYDFAKQEKYRYVDDKYGHAEGLAMDEKTIWVILDNNRDARVSDPDNNKSQLFRFKNPW